MVVYAKQPFAGPAQVLEYLGRYTHKVAISNNRIKEVANGKVLFSYKELCRPKQTKANEPWCWRIFTQVLPAHITTKVYENKALWNTGKQSKIKAAYATNAYGCIGTKHTTGQLERGVQNQPQFWCGQMSLLQNKNIDKGDEF